MTTRHYFHTRVPLSLIIVVNAGLFLAAFLYTTLKPAAIPPSPLTCQQWLAKKIADPQSHGVESRDAFYGFGEYSFDYHIPCTQGEWDRFVRQQRGY